MELVRVVVEAGAGGWVRAEVGSSFYVFSRGERPEVWLPTVPKALLRLG